jgi:hypothetical protein
MPSGRSEAVTMPTRKAILAAIASAALLLCIAVPATAEEPEHICNQDAMLVFDASGSMSGDGWGYGSESANTVTRIQKVRAALAKVLPSITHYRRVGLITFGPNQCNVKLELKPTENSASRILSIVDDLIPAGQTPLSAAEGAAIPATKGVGAADRPIVRWTSLIGGIPHRHRRTGSSCGWHRLDRIRDRLLARSTARRHVDLQRISHALSCLPRFRGRTDRHFTLASCSRARDPDGTFGLG